MSSLAKSNSRLYCIDSSSYSGASMARRGFTVTMLFVRPMMNVNGSSVALVLASCANAEPERPRPASIPNTTIVAIALRMVLMPRLLLCIDIPWP
jgi:hypothetical protein